MRKRLAKTGKGLALIVVTPVRTKKRTAKLAAALQDINARYAGVFKRLAE